MFDNIVAATSQVFAVTGQAFVVLAVNTTYFAANNEYGLKDGVTCFRVSQYFTRILVRHNLKKIRFHDLRHTYATLMLHGGVSLKDIQ